MFRNNLFIKICLSFWLTTLFMIGAVVTVDWLTEMGPFHSERHPIHGSPLAVHGQAFAWILEHEGVSSLRDFADRLDETSGIRVHFFDQSGIDFTGKPGAPGAGALAASVMKNRGADFVPPGKGSMAVLRIVGSDGKSYAVVAEMPPFPPPRDSREPWIMIVVRLLVVLTVSGLICYLLARYLTAPILKLGAAARRLASGDLSARVSPALGSRKDEISLLALDFDIMAKRIESLLNSQRILLRDISHELRSPLARLNVALELCRKGSEAEIRKSLGRIERESGRLNDMIGHLLTLNRVEFGISVLEKKRIDLAKMIREIADDADFEAKSLNRGGKITAIEACFIEGDEDLLRRAIENVARNAVRDTQDGSNVEVSLRCTRNRSDSMGLITIRDHGKGVPEASLPHLFQPFYRVGDSRERETGGTGLGLAITEAAVRFHGGTVTAANSSEEGVIIEISLPILSAVAESASKESSNR
ncbi:MAG: ATP-binding protein [Syntrophales bacterium]|nr:ATP-binding protein [Syntrophales bacterium]